MKLTIFENCHGGHNPTEVAIKIEWGGEVPKVGELVSMGQAARWYVNRVSRYESSLLRDLYLVEVGLELGAPTRRSTDRPYFEFANTPIFGGAGYMPLGMGYLADPSCDYNRGQLYNYVNKQGFFEKTLRPWQVADVEVFVKIDEHAPYATLAICWCTAIPERELVAA